MPLVACANCRTGFYAKPSWIKNGGGKYCSQICSHQAQKRGKVASCYICKKQVYKSQQARSRSKSGNFFCGKSCQAIWRNSKLYIGEYHVNWKGGRSSYRQRLLRTDLAQVCSKCETDDKRVLAVHHKDKNRLNNKFSNLIWLCHNCHYLVHHYKDESEGFVVPVA